MEKSILKNLVNEDKELSDKIEKAIIEVVKANGGFIDMRETDGRDKCYVILNDEEHQRYGDCFVNAVAIFDGSLCVLTTELSKYPYEGEKDELLESDEWMSISGGMFWRNASLVALAETIEQYVEK